MGPGHQLRRTIHQKAIRIMYENYEAEICRYENFIGRVLASGDMSFFKRHRRYIVLLEHASKQWGRAYLELIYSKFSLSESEVRSFCELNDKIGSPRLCSRIISGLSVSPTSLGYIFHALVILEHCQQLGLREVKIVELGGGYGGLLLAINQFQKRMGVDVQQYRLIDLEQPLALQKKYLANFQIGFPISFHDARNHGEDVEQGEYFLTSVYCFSEISPVHQEAYRTHLLPKCKHGFMIWNVRGQITLERELKISCPLGSWANNRYVCF